jgi:Beta-lactamase enzyme family
VTASPASATATAVEARRSSAGSLSERNCQIPSTTSRVAAILASANPRRSSAVNPSARVQARGASHSAAPIASRPAPSPIAVRQIRGSSDRDRSETALTAAAYWRNCVIVLVMRTVVLVLVALVAWLSIAVAGQAGETAPSAAPSAAERPRAKIPSPAAMREAWTYARRRSGVASFAVVDTEGKLRGRAEAHRYPAASVVKAMLLAAEVRRLRHAGINSTTDRLLTAMITRSDNDAADAIYARVGDAGLFGVARRAEMKRFTVAGHWGNARITAADMARFFGDLDRVLVRRHREYAKGLLGSITPSQRWGIPAAAEPKWAVRFKGGWLPSHALAHQAAELRERHGPRELSMAVLTDEQPSHGYATETVRGVAERLLNPSGGGA